MRLPGGIAFLIRRCVPRDRVTDVLGDLEEVHRERVETRGRGLATLLTTLEAIEMAVAGLRLRLGIAWAPPVSWIDLRLAWRLLLKYPGITLVGGAATAFAIFVGVGCYEVYSQLLHPTLPLEEGDRVVAVTLLDGRTQEPESRLLHDFRIWRSELSTVVDLGAARLFFPNLVTGDEAGEPVQAAAVTASAFEMTRVAPLRGRTLVPTDESPSAPDVAVLSHDVWTARFAGDEDIVGRPVSLSERDYTIVGVMPPGFGFPISERLWVPLRPDPSVEPLQGPAVMVFGRLAPGIGLPEARSQLQALIANSRSTWPEAYEHLHPRILPHAESAFAFWGTGDRIAIASINVFAGLFLFLVAGNVALLMFARGAARESEMVVRTALGASRRRIVWQLFAESLVLSSIAAVVGVAAAGWGLERLVHAVWGEQPIAFWLRASVSPRSLVYASVLTVLAAALSSLIPGLKATSGGVDARLRRMTSGGGGLRLGGVWTMVLVLQVAATVTFPAVGWFVREDSVRIRSYEYAFPSHEYLTARPLVGLGTASGTSDGATEESTRAEYARVARALTERLEAEPEVAGVTWTRAFPGRYQSWRRIEMDAGGLAPPDELDLQGPGRRVSGSVVTPDFFDVLAVAPTEGRAFNAEDADPEARTVIVNEAFVEHVLGGRNAVGRRLRYLGSGEGWDGVALGDEPGPWYRIVGVVPALGESTDGLEVRRGSGLYHVVPFGSAVASSLLLRVHGDPSLFAARLRKVASEVDPDLALAAVLPLDALRDNDLRSYGFWVAFIVVVSAVAMLLSLTAIYSVLSFNVARRTREIGVRVALGGRSARVAVAIFRRPLARVGAGLAAGLLLTTVLGVGIDPGELWGRPLLAVLGYGLLMTAVCSLACIVPTRRALAVEPNEALRAEG